jgi:DNA-binding response OmpR family regulator
VRALLIEDDSKLGDLTREYLQHQGIDVTLVGDGNRGLQEALSGHYDVVLLDLMLPGIGGLEICKRLRRESAVPLLILSARGDEVDKIVGLELGADDYLSKPYSPRELLARINAVLRRGSATARPTEVVRAGPLLIDRTRRVASLVGQPLELTAYQFDVLWILCQAPERVFSRKQIYQQVRSAQELPPEAFDPSIDRSVDVHLSKVRQAL